jgi:hypothetical protein
VRFDEEPNIKYQSSACQPSGGGQRERLHNLYRRNWLLLENADRGILPVSRPMNGANCLKERHFAVAAFGTALCGATKALILLAESADSVNEATG